jgi:hypothetical protein
MDALLLSLTILALGAAVIFGASAWRARAEARQRSAARVAELASALSPSGETAAPQPVAVESLFASVAADRRLVTTPMIAAAVSAVALVAGGTVLRDDAAPAAARAGGAAALELVSMRHARDGHTLTVTGLVRNPSSGAALSDVTVLIFTFDRAGEFVASSRGALAFAVLQPGDEAPFAVTVTDLADLRRYRVSFRTPAGPLRHVDRRAAGRTS